MGRANRHALFALLLPAAFLLVGNLACAHPVPDRLFDRSIRIVVSPRRVQITYELSLTQLTLAEELLSIADPDQVAASSLSDLMRHYASQMGPVLAGGIALQVDGRPVPVQFRSATSQMEVHPKFVFLMEAQLDQQSGVRQLEFEEKNFYGEKGVIRVAAAAGAGCQIVDSSVPSRITDRSVRAWELTPEQQEQGRHARLRWQPAATAAGPGGRAAGPAQRTGPAAAAGPARPALPLSEPEPGRPSTAKLGGGSQTRSGPGRPTKPAPGSRPSRWMQRKMSAMLSARSPWLATVMLALAFFFGAAHALTPGHGKTMVAAYLVGERGTLVHAIGLGLMTSAAHTGSVLGVALLLALTSPVLDRKLHTGISLASGLLVAALGAWLLAVRLAERWGGGGRRPGGRAGSWPAADPNAPLGWGALAMLGFSGGMVPCWDAIALLLWALFLRRMVWGLLLLISFSAGLASVLTVVGVMAVKVGGFLSSRMGNGRIVRAMPVASAVIILVMGLYLCRLSLAASGIGAGPLQAVPASAVDSR